MCFAAAYHITLVGAQHTDVGIHAERARLAFILICGEGAHMQMLGPKKAHLLISAYLCHLRYFPLWISIMAQQDKHVNGSKGWR